MVKPSGPHHFASCVGSLKRAEHDRTRGGKHARQLESELSMAPPRVDSAH